jgi:hypothetical protein
MAQGCLNVLAALRLMLQARWQCLKFSGAGHLPTSQLILQSARLHLFCHPQLL